MQQAMLAWNIGISRCGACTCSEYMIRSVGYSSESIIVGRIVLLLVFVSVSGSSWLYAGTAVYRVYQCHGVMPLIPFFVGLSDGLSSAPDSFDTEP